MFLVDNFISFHDLSPNACFLWASSSIVVCLGYEPEEIVGLNAYKVIHPEDLSHVKITHQENVLNEMVGTQVLLRMKHKEGHFVPCMVLFSMCYDYIVSCYTVVDEQDGTIRRKISAHSAAMTSIVGSKKEEFERIRRHHEAFRANSWNPNSLDPEPRACMLLNRFSRSLGIMYASPSCEMILQVDPDLIVGKPLLLFIRADDLGSFVEQVDLAKSSTVVTHMRFWFQSPACRQEIPCEAMLFGAADGMIVILRRCQPFIRKQLITAGFSSDYFASASSANSSFNSHTNLSSCDQSSNDQSKTNSRSNSYNNSHSSSRNVNNNSNAQRGSYSNSHPPHHFNTNHSGNYNSSYNGSYNNQNSGQHLHPPGGSGDPRLAKIYSINGAEAKMSTCSSATLPSSPTESMSSSFSSSASGSSSMRGTRVYRASLHGVAIGSINSIRNLDREQNRLRPLTSLHMDESDIVDSDTALPDTYRLRRHHIQDSEVEDSGLEARIKKIDLDADYMEHDDYEDEEGDYDDEEEEHQEIQMPPSRHPQGGRDWPGDHGYRYDMQSKFDLNVGHN